MEGQKKINNKKQKMLETYFKRLKLEKLSKDKDLFRQAAQDSLL